MTAEKELILDHEQIFQKIKRISFEILENNLGEKELILAGITGGGYKLASLIIDELKQETDTALRLIKITLDKKAPIKSKIEVDCDIQTLRGKTVIIVDDVLHTGKTFIQGMKPFLEVDVKKIQTAVLINRSHLIFPVTSNYTGYELSTTLNDHIMVDLQSKEFGVFLY
jgi:pyrimidine operon attenuation protein/uracil phosphoribosyltransferase